MTKRAHDVVVYFAGWHLGEGGIAHGGEVAGLPWDQVSYVNHAFWYVEPTEAPEVTSFRQRETGNGPRTEFRIVSMHPELDLGDCGESTLIPGLPRNHFAQYAHFAKRHPDVNILISIGGWTKCGFFSEMAFTKAGRSSFIGACLDLMDRNPWIGGIDIDWEYPACNPDGERPADPNDPGDQGCPIFGTAAQDRENFPLLLAEFRAALDEHFGPGVKKLTACASGSTGWTLPCQDWPGAAGSLDLINIMSYDLAGIYDGKTGFASSAAQASAAAMYFRDLGISLSKVCIGSPLYGTPFQRKTLDGSPLGSPCEPWKPVGTERCTQDALLQWEAEAGPAPGWHCGYSQEDGAPYLWNDDPQSPCCKWFLSYENSRSLQQKLDDICKYGIRGIIVWESSQDTADFRMIGQMWKNLNKGG